jgi:dihydrofolate reductase
MIRLIAAIDTDSGIPWNLPGDSAYFRDKTRTGLIVMGRATYNEFAVPLHGRDNFVLTAQPGSLRAGFRSVAGLDQLSTDHPGEDIWVIGGAAVYAETINDASELLITQVLADFNCTKFFPAYAGPIRTRDPERGPRRRRHQVPIRDVATPIAVALFTSQENLLGDSCVTQVRRQETPPWPIRRGRRDPPRG